ncbi:MAG: tetratricopeptide repeat protein [Halarsenatibacteraceae bacterium]
MREETYLDDYSEDLVEKYKQGTEFIDRGKDQEGEEVLREVIEREENFAPAYNKLAVMHIRQDNKEKAREILEYLLAEIDPKFPPALTNIGSLEREEGNTYKAKELYQEAIELNSEYGPAYNNLGVILREEGEISKSVKYLKKARKLGTYAFESKKDTPIYKDPGCMVPIILALIFVVLTIFWLF